MGTNDEGRMALDLPSGRTAVLRPYDAYCADAIGDVALQETGEAYDKLISGLVETLDGVPFPDFETKRKKAVKFARDLLVGDYHHIIFMAIASYRGGHWEGNVILQSGDELRASVQLLEEDGSPVENYNPPPYPFGNEKVHEWEEEIEEIGEKRTFKIHLLDGHARARIASSGRTNVNMDMIQRRAMYRDSENDIWIRYDPKTRPPAWASRAITTKAREVDPVIQYLFQAVDGRGRKHVQTLMGATDFFLQDFI